jgi:hypothetical protein
MGMFQLCLQKFKLGLASACLFKLALRSELFLFRFLLGYV